MTVAPLRPGRPVRPGDPDWPRVDVDQLYRRFGPGDWARCVKDFTGGAVGYSPELQECPYCLTESDEPTLTVTRAKGTKPPRFRCTRCERDGDILDLIALEKGLRVEPYVDAFDLLWRWADDHELPEVYKPAKQAVRADLLSARRLLQRDPDLRGLVSYDLFRNEVVLERPIPRPDYGLPKDWVPRPLADEDVTALTEVLLDRKLIKASSTLVHEVLRGIARDISRHPVRDWLRSLEWDGIERLSHWLKDYGSAVTEDPENRASEDRREFVEAVSRKALIGAVARIMQPGCKHDHVLTLIGKQGILKSKLLAALVPDPTWSSDSLTHDMGDKDAIVGLAGTWICEMAELAALNKTDFALAKAFLSRQVDKFRPPFGRLDVRLPRQVAFFATTNLAEPFKDESGNRRYWPIECGRLENGQEIPLDPDGLAAIRDQLWAEAVHGYDAGEQWWLTSNVEGIARGEQDRRRAVHALAGRVAEAIKTMEPPISIDAILNLWDTKKTDWVRLSMEVGKALAELRYTKRRTTIDGQRLMLWDPPPANS